MLNKSNPIGVMDSGIGGLTVVRELQRILPGEDIIYFGDSANCPYGNKTADQIFELSCHMLQFLGSNGVKCTAVACNTISTMAERLRPCFGFRIISIVEEAAKYVIREKLSSVGLIGTEFTVASGKYAELIHQGNPSAMWSARVLPCSRRSWTAATSINTTSILRSPRRSTTFSPARRSTT